MSVRLWFLPVVLAMAFVKESACQCQNEVPWVGTWASSQQSPEPANRLDAKMLDGAVLRQSVHLSIGGRFLRLHVSNVFGDEPLHLRKVHIALPDSTHPGQIQPDTDTEVRFAGKSDVIIPPGAEYLSDQVSFNALPLSNLMVTIQFGEGPVGQTSHSGSRSTSYLAHGSNPSDVSLSEPIPIDHWFQISGIDVLADSKSYAVVVLGDSITDGRGSTTNKNNRWTDLLASRLQSIPSLHHIAILNQGIGGNRLLNDGLGPNALARLDRDVLAQSGVRVLIVLEGVNDLGTATLRSEITMDQHRALVFRIEDSYRQIIERAHSHHIAVYGGTITPFGGSAYYHPSTANEADRQEVNAWIREKGHFDGVIDFDRALADPAQLHRLKPEFDSGDHLHPSPAGFQAMADDVPISLLEKASCSW
jgi:lysophospholipase L1-like esterase